MAASDIEKLQEHLMILLEEVDRICQKHQLSYMLFAGTLLGAVRHKDFIPWDDDIDVLMPREDYQRFLDIAQRECDKNVFFVQREFSHHWPMHFSKLRLQNTAYIEKYHPKDPLQHQGIYIDIFPYDDGWKSRLGRKIQFLLSKAVIADALRKRGYDTDSKWKKLAMAISKVLPERTFHKMITRPGAGSRYVHTFFGAGKKFRSNVFPRQWLQQTEQREFNGKKFPIPTNYNEILTQLYGEYRELPSEKERECKIHAVVVDFEKSYEYYQHWRDGMKFSVHTRSIR